MEQHDIFEPEKHIPGWKHMDCCPPGVNLQYWVIKPEGKNNGRALFYLHGLGGHPREQDKLAYFLARSGYTVFLMDQPGTKALYTVVKNLPRTILRLPKFNTGEVLKGLWNGYRAIEQLAIWWGFNQVDIVCFSYGGLPASVMAAHSPLAHRFLILSSTLDIADAIQNFHRLPGGILMGVVNLLVGKTQGDAKDMVWDKGPYAKLYKEIHSWRIPANPNLRVTYINNKSDPVMRWDPLQHAANLAKENGFDGFELVKSETDKPWHADLEFSRWGGLEGVCKAYLLYDEP